MLDMDLVKRVWNEEGMMELLGVKHSQLKNMVATKGLPCVRLFNGKRVFLAEEVMVYLEQRSAAQKS